MKCLIVLLCFLALLLAGNLKHEGLPGVESQTSGAGTRFITEPCGSMVTPSVQTNFQSNSRAYLLWVDRNHQFAIAAHTAISGNGEWIQAGWYLNNERTSLYPRTGTGIPIWNFPMPGAEWFIPTDISLDGDDIGVIAQGTPCYSFASDSGIPNWTYTLPPGFAFATTEHGSTICVSDDGTIYAALAQQGSDARIFVLDDSGDTIRTISFDPNTGIYGLDMATDGSVFCVSTYNVIYIFNADGSRRDSISQYGQTVAKISGDGKYLVKGDFYSCVYLYRWNGSDYGQVWQYYTGHPWVTRVAISRDGSTIMAGTYQYSPSNSGKVLLFDSSSATPLWEYSQYGDYVAACALSADGYVAAAGSWGQYGGTYGDVLTIFNRFSPDPVFQLLDDIDEPGSIFSVDISNDGWFVTAAGKAVHAREFGNGGQVYAICSMDAINEHGHEAPVRFELTTPKPNPFTRSLIVHFSAPRKAKVSLKVYDITGRLLTAILEANIEPGYHEVLWTGTDESGQNLGSGIYFLRADYEDITITRKLIHFAD